jgi:hypothetical protein
MWTGLQARGASLTLTKYFRIWQPFCSETGASGFHYLITSIHYIPFFVRYCPCPLHIITISSKMTQSSLVSRLVTPTLIFLVLCLVDYQEKDFLQLLIVKDCDVKYLPLTNIVQEDVTTAKDHNDAGNIPSCIWSPKPVNATYRGTSCMKTLTQAIHHLHPNGTVPQRWMFFGDSTMARLFTRSPLMDHFVDDTRVNQACPGIYQCRTYKHAKCNLDLKFGIRRVETWMPPNFTLGEGPEAFGATHPYCQDCNGCSSYYTLCHPQYTKFSSCPFRSTHSVLYVCLPWGLL